MIYRQSVRSLHRGFSLIEILVVLLVVAALAAVTYSAYIGHSGKKGERSHGPIAEAKSSVCQENLHQARMAIDMLHSGDADNKFPESIADLKFPRESIVCPDGGEPYNYDPATGEIHCVHPGHEKY